MSFAPPTHRTLARPYVQRAVHLLITPRPSNLGESREIHRLLSQFGEIEYFKSLKYDVLSAPNAALVIYKDEQGARNCLQRSPIRFRMGRVRGGSGSGRELEGVQHELEGQVGSESGRASLGERREREKRQPRGPVGGAFGLSSSQTQTRNLSTSALPTPPRNKIRMPFDPPRPAEPSANNNDTPRFFQIQTNPSRRNFQHHVNVGAFHGSFQIDRQMFGQEDLEKKVPFVGLSCVDWKKSERLWRNVDEERVRYGSRGSLGQLAAEARGEEFRQREIRREGGFGDVQVGVGVGDEESALEESGREIKDDFFTPFGSGGAPKKKTAKERENVEEEEEPPLHKAMRGWEDFFPGISSGEEVERYSRKRK